MAAKVLPNGKQQYFDTSTDPITPLSGGKVYTYAAGTAFATPKKTYNSSTVSVGTENANPVILNSRGEATIFWSGAYGVVIKDSNDVTIYSVDNISTEVEATDITYGGTTIAVLLLDNISHVVETISDLRAVDKTKYTHCKVTGYYANGDGGGGDYWYDSSDTTSSDNGGTIIVGTDGGRWKMLLSENRVSVLQFGAKPDQITDATTAFTNALACFGDEGGIVTVDGQFYVAAGSSMTIPYGYTLKGFNLGGKAGAIQLGAFGPDAVPSVIFTDELNIKVQGGARLEGCAVLEASLYTAGGTFPYPTVDASAPASYSGTGVLPDPNSQIVNNQIAGFTYGIGYVAGGSGTGYATLITGNSVDCINGIYLTSAYTSGLEIPKISGNQIYSFMWTGGNARNGYGIFFDANANISGTVIRENYVTNYTYGCINIADTQDIWIEDNYLIQATGVNPALKIDGLASTSMHTITGNYIYNTLDDCIEITQGCALITGNTIENTLYGVNLSSSNVGYTVIRANRYATISTAVTGDATALLKCMNGEPLNAHDPTVFTPLVAFAGSTASNTYSTNTGRYVVMDNLVVFSLHIVMSGRGGSASDAMTITSLPFTSANLAGSQGGGAVAYYANFTTLSSSITWKIAANASVIDLYQEGATSSTAILKSDTDNTSEVIIHGSYFISR